MAGFLKVRNKPMLFNDVESKVKRSIVALKENAARIELRNILNPDIEE